MTKEATIKSKPGRPRKEGSELENGDKLVKLSNLKRVIAQRARFDLLDKNTCKAVIKSYVRILEQNQINSERRLCAIREMVS